MPYIGRDWRQPGELWVRTTEGWERLELWRLRFLENLNENVTERRKLMSLEDGTDSHTPKSRLQPHVFIVKGTQERKLRTSLSEAFNRLDMMGAIKDTRRLNYVANVVEILIKSKLSSLSGTAQKMLFGLLEEMLQQAVKTEHNVRMLQHLLGEVRLALKRCQIDHVGSSVLWQKHEQNVDKMQNTLNSFQYKERDDDGKVTMSDLPDDCIRHILKRMADHKDILHTGLTESRNLDLTQETQIWRDLCVFHFDDVQICSVMKKGEDVYTLGWQKLYRKLVKRYGMRAVFAECLHMCKVCNAVFWSGHGHPCLCPHMPPRSQALSPHTCVALFDV